MGDDVDLAIFLQQRNKALEELDEAFVERWVPGCAPDLRLTVLHKARYSCTAIADKLRHESGDWLRERGLGAVHGPLLPKGELPK